MKVKDFQALGLAQSTSLGFLVVQLFDKNLIGRDVLGGQFLLYRFLLGLSVGVGAGLGLESATVVERSGGTTGSHLDPLAGTVQGFWMPFPHLTTTPSVGGADDFPLVPPPVVLHVEEEVPGAEAEGDPEENITVVGHDKEHDAVGDERVDEEENEHRELRGAVELASGGGVELLEEVVLGDLKEGPEDSQ